MNKEKDNKEELNELDDFKNRYQHYIYDDIYDTVDDNESPSVSDTYEDISSFSDGHADFFMQKSSDEEINSYIDKSLSDDINMTGTKNNKKKKAKGNFFTRNQYRNSKIIALLLVIAFLLVIGGGLVYLYVITGGGDYGDSGLDFNDPLTDQIYDEDHNWTAMGDVDANSLNGYLYSWANNGGEKMYSKNVINVLLCGVDSETGDASSGRSDIMMLVSINKRTKTITMVSFLRDSWTYMSLPKQDGTYYDYYFKLNSAYNYGGPATLLETLENNFKIEIDQFIAVDFNSFPKLIDALGGVTVDVQQYESDYIRRTSRQKDFPVGLSKLNGIQALTYSRIRKCDADGDISRTRRQRSIIKSLIDSAKSASNGQLLNAFKLVSPYLRTGYSQSEVFTLIAQAFTNGWMNYEFVELVLPNEDYVDRLSTKINGQWAWIADYPSCAQKLQQALYGQTNIVLSDDRVTMLDFVTNTNQDQQNNSADNGSDLNNGVSDDSGYESDGSNNTDTDDSGDRWPNFTFPSLGGNDNGSDSGSDSSGSDDSATDDGDKVGDKNFNDNSQGTNSEIN